MRISQETEVTGAVEGLYSAFCHYRLVKHVQGCPCCVGKQDQRALESAPLRELSAEQLSRFAFKALTTWGNQADLKHFLPRVLQLVLSEQGIGCDVEVVFGKLGLASWESWPPEERAAIRRFFRAGWHLILTQAEPWVEPDTWLCAMAGAGEDLIDYLHEWASFRANPAYQHLLAFIELNQPWYIKRHSLANAFWPSSPKGVAAVCGWLTDSKTRDQLETIYFENETAAFAPTLAKVVDRLVLIARA